MGLAVTGGNGTGNGGGGTDHLGPRTLRGHVWTVEVEGFVRASSKFRSETLVPGTVSQYTRTISGGTVHTNVRPRVLVQPSGDRQDTLVSSDHGGIVPVP